MAVGDGFKKELERIVNTWLNWKDSGEKGKKNFSTPASLPLITRRSVAHLSGDAQSSDHYRFANTRANSCIIPSPKHGVGGGGKLLQFLLTRTSLPWDDTEGMEQKGGTIVAEC